MVDFDNEATITRAPAEIVKIMLLERRKYLIDSLEFYYKQRLQKIEPKKYIVGARLTALFYEIYEELERHYKKEEFIELEKNVLSYDFDKMLQAIKLINRWFDLKRLTRIDTIKPYDSTMVETENLAKGL